MKPLIQKLPLDSSSSFVARTYRTPVFETPWHQHVEFELLRCTGSYGTAFVGDYIGEYQAGDIFLLGQNLPHWFRKKEIDKVGSALVVQFRAEIFGNTFLNLPEMNPIKQLLEQSAQGLALKGKLKDKLTTLLDPIEASKGFVQLSLLLSALHEISISDEFDYLTQSPILNYSLQDQALIHQVYEYSMQHFQRKIKLEELAALTNKSVSAFCHYFKKSTKKSYVQFLTEIRIAHACKLLTTTQLSVTEICYASGFHNWANFSEHFSKLKQQSPLKYRQMYRQEG